jgi:predicted ester cyclase
MTTSNADVIRQLYRAIENKDTEALDRLGGDAPFENLAFAQTLSVSEDSKVLYEAFPDLRIEIHSIIEQGNLVVVEGSGHGTHKGVLRHPAGELPPTGRRLDLRFVDIYEVEDGRVQRGRYYIDRLSLFEQLGIAGGLSQGPQVGKQPAVPVH